MEGWCLHPLVSLSSWAKWIDRFEAATLVNGCDDEKKWLWFLVRLPVKVQTRGEENFILEAKGAMGHSMANEQEL